MTLGKLTFGSIERYRVTPGSRVLAQGHNSRLGKISRFDAEPTEQTDFYDEIPESMLRHSRARVTEADQFLHVEITGEHGYAEAIVPSKSIEPWQLSCAGFDGPNDVKLYMLEYLDTEGLQAQEVPETDPACNELKNDVLTLRRLFLKRSRR